MQRINYTVKSHRQGSKYEMPWLLCFGKEENGQNKDLSVKNPDKTQVASSWSRTFRTAQVAPLFNPKFSELSFNPERVKTYLTTIARSTFCGDNESENSQLLGTLMRKLYELVENGKALSNESQEMLQKLIKVRTEHSSQKEIFRARLKDDFGRYLLIKQDRDRRISKTTTLNSIAWSTGQSPAGPLEKIAVLTPRHHAFWGSRQQLRSGKIVGDMLSGLDPVFGVLLNPTGGRIGRGDSEKLHKLLYKDEESVAYHSAVHDAFGYLYQYHGLGPGYDYLRSKWTLFKRESPLSGHTSGLKYWKRVLRDAREGEEF
ncbi:uncharacterized protein LOC116618386 [Nematostella vectensis]|uniref:uncharacterized protein LOC116618386 n=1 Tax=Nematostella vectensis TaxID=45351 RepID=UPI0020777872|nr:uncharacterized protein LOC116618386 [Nematostella vectensis]